MTYRYTLKGRCHCGAIGVEYRTDTPPEDSEVRACQCAFCRRHAANTVSDPVGMVVFRESEPGMTRHYRFGLNTADYLICARCGVYVGATCDVDGAGYGIVNANVLEDRVRYARTPKPMTYDGEAMAQRLARRKERWTPLER